MEFVSGEKIISADGQELGKLDRTIVDPQTDQVIGIVVQRGLLLKQDKVLPIEIVADSSGERITLKPFSGSWDQLPDYESAEYIPYDERQSGGINPSVTADTVFWYPPVGSAGGLIWPGAALIDLFTPARTPVPVERRKNINVPPGTVAIREKARVISIEGKHVGAVDEIVTAQGQDQITHIIVTSGILSKERRLIPIGWVKEVFADEVHLGVKAAMIDHLPRIEVGHRTRPQED